MKPREVVDGQAFAYRQTRLTRTRVPVYPAAATLSGAGVDMPEDRKTLEVLIALGKCAEQVLDRTYLSGGRHGEWTSGHWQEARDILMFELVHGHGDDHIDNAIDKALRHLTRTAAFPHPRRQTLPG